MSLLTFIKNIFCFGNKKEYEYRNQKLVIKDIDIPELSFLPVDILSLIIDYDYYFQGKSVSIMKRRGGGVNCVSVLPDGRIVSGSSDNTISVWNTNSGQCTMTLKGHNGSVRCVLVLPDGSIVSGSSDNTIRAWNPNNGKCTMILKYRCPVYCVSVLPDGRIVSGSGDGTVSVWNTNSGQCTMILKGHNGYVPVRCVSVLPDGSIVSG